MMVTLWTIPRPISWNCRNLLPHPSHKLHLLQLHQTKNPVSRPNGISTTGTFLISTILRAFQRQMKTKTELVRMLSCTQCGNKNIISILKYSLSWAFDRIIKNNFIPRKVQFGINRGFILNYNSLEARGGVISMPYLPVISTAVCHWWWNHKLFNLLYFCLHIYCICQCNRMSGSNLNFHEPSRKAPNLKTYF